ncbi:MULTISPECIES: hypothetical protein [unclassified Paenibacillus]|uniref:Uncharacterized protein n=1 Tax=Paenibacillus provencensis TaxID=441151 RepID=A0ABW3PVS7_9BACL|nr:MULTISPECIES: hypothetical protein [unclassified Paenibacillus]MCM3128741.1 hypothetical protein [Paenibacillus sp. MER 78]SFS48239.1 hypothetical protein SAMN04488601_101991 [Paenibacillus sp. 453mf]
MSLKAVELQIAIPRTSEAGRYQSEYDHRRSSEQSLLADNQSKQIKKKAKQSPKTNESEQASIKDQRNSSHTMVGQLNQSNEQADETATVPAEHPFKGKNFDVSL